MPPPACGLTTLEEPEMSVVADPVTDVNSREHSPGPARELRRCQCVGVLGMDRHRICWPPDVPPDGPVLDRCRVGCRRPLPGKQAHCLERA